MKRWLRRMRITLQLLPSAVAQGWAHGVMVLDTLVSLQVLKRGVADGGGKLTVKELKVTHDVTPSDPST